MLKSYEPSGNCDGSGLTILFLTAFISCLLVGGLYGAISRWIDLIIVFPICVGAAFGYLMSFGTKWGHCRNMTYVWIIAIVLGASLFVVKYFVHYKLDRGAMEESAAQAIMKQFPGKPIPPNAPSFFVDEYYREKFGFGGFIGYFLSVIKSGMVISDVGKSAKDGANLGSVGTIILFLVEIIFAAALAGVTARLNSFSPYCEKCLCWAEEQWTKYTSPETVIELCKELSRRDEAKESLDGLLNVKEDSDDLGKVHGRVHLMDCARCKASFLTVSIFQPAADGNEANEEKMLTNICLTPEQTESLLKVPM